VYYIDAQQGFYYAILTNKTTRVFYLDSSGNTIYISAYRWDLNTSWIIFQRPPQHKNILKRRELFDEHFLDPTNWFSGNQASATPYYSISVSFPSPWSTAQSTTIYPDSSRVTITRWLMDRVLS